MSALCEGVAINAVVRMTGIANTTILRLLADIGRVCLNHEDHFIGDMVGLLEADEADAVARGEYKQDPYGPRA